MNIGSGNKCVSSRLSNFTHHPFIFDGVECNSMEGLLQSFKFEDVVKQQEICKLIGFPAKRKGSKRNKAWKSCQCLWWKGEMLPRGSVNYQILLDGAFLALSTNKDFANDLLCTKHVMLRHTCGKRHREDTTLTRREFCSRLGKLRRKLRRENE